MKYTNLILLTAISLILFSSLITAQYDWSSYGNNLITAPQSQVGDGISRFDEGYLNISVSEGYELSSSVPTTVTQFQPLVTYIDDDFSTSHQYLIFPSTNYLQVYDEDLNLLNERSLDLDVISQIDILDFDVDGKVDDIIGLYEYNSTLATLYVVSLNATDNDLNIIYSENFTIANYLVGGIRHQNNEAYFVYSNGAETRFVYVDNGGSTDNLVLNYSDSFIQPVSFADVDDDGTTEFLTYSGDKVILFDKNGNVEFNVTGLSSIYGGVLDAKIFQPDATSIYKFVYLTGSSLTNTFQLFAYKPDGSAYWNKPFTGGGGTPRGSLAVADYNNDGYDDIYVSSFDVRFTTQYLNTIKFRTYKGNNGDLLDSQDYNDKSGWAYNPASGGSTTLTLADLNDDSIEDFIFNIYNGHLVYNLDDDETYIERTPSGNFYYSCIPADLTFNGYQEIICSGEDETIMYFANISNQNPTISSVTYDPSTVVQVNDTLNMYVSATDNEGDTIYYSARCSDSDSWSAEQTTTSFSCEYVAEGIYNNSVRVRDLFHSTYDVYSTDITVSTTGEICDNDGICESGQGEDYLTCPNDCPAPSVNYTQSEGGIAIPTELVNTENTNQGLLPEIYFGTLGFFSSILEPSIVLIFGIIFVLIIITIAIIVKKVTMKIGNLS